MEILGIDIGGTGVKGAIVDTSTGELVTERFRIPTPQPATPSAIANTLAEVVAHFNWSGPVGAGFPSAILHGVAKTASNVDKAFIGINLQALFSHETGCPVYVANDADVAGLAEFSFGEGKDQQGLVIMITVGTGIGTVIINHGQLQPNSELGHIYLNNGIKAEDFAANSVRKKLNLSWKQWGKRLSLYLETMEELFYPDLFVLGGGVSKHFEQYQKYLNTNTQVQTASFLNQAGIVGAALYAKSQHNALN